MSGPYDQSGLSEGFVNGYGLALQASKQKADQAYQQHSMTIQDQEAQRQQQLADSTTAYQSGELGIAQAGNARAQAQSDYETAPAQRQLQRAATQAQIDHANASSRAELTNAAAAAQTAKAHSDYYASETDKNTVELHDRQLLQDLTTTKARLSGIGDLNNPDFQHTAMELDAFAHGQSPTIQNPQATFGLLSKSLPELQDNVGKPINPAHAQDYGIPVGSTLVSNSIVDAHINPQTGDTVFQVAHNYKTPDGRILPAQMPHVDSGDNVIVIPQHRMQMLAQGLGTTALMAKHLNLQGADANSMMNDIDAQIDGIVSKDPAKYIKTRNGYITNLETGDVTQTHADPRIQIQFEKERQAVMTNPLYQTPALRNAALAEIDAREASLGGTGSPNQTPLAATNKPPPFQLPDSSSTTSPIKSPPKVSLSSGFGKAGKRVRELQQLPLTDIDYSSGS